MTGYLMACAVSWTCVAGPGQASRPHDTPPTTTTSAPAVEEDHAGLPPATFEDLVLLVRTARRSFRAAVLGTGPWGSGYQPPALAEVRGRVHLVLRQDGVALAEAESPEAGIVDAAATAGTLLGRIVRDRKERFEKRPDVLAGGDDAGLEFEWIGAPEYLSPKFDEGGRWSEALVRSFEPGVEGIGVEFRREAGRTRPGQTTASNYTPDLALAAAEAAIGVRHEDKVERPDDIRYFRFRTHHLWQATARDLPRPLMRGETPVAASQVDRESLDAAIQRLADYLRYRQNRDGWFSYEYMPSADRYSDENSGPAQMRAMSVLARYAAWSKRPEFEAAALRGVEVVLPHVRPLAVGPPGADGQPAATPVGSVLSFQGHEHQLKVSALLVSTLTALGLPSQHSELLEALADGLLASQDEAGRFEMVFGARTGDEREDDEAAGRAMAALAEWAARERNPRVEQALQRGFTHYRARLGATQPAARKLGDVATTAAGAGAMAEALAAQYGATADARVSDVLFLLLDRFADLQITEAACPWPELLGAINVREAGAVGADTATYLAALADGLRVAKRVGDRRRIERYEGVVRAGCRFVMQLQFTESGCYYVRSPRDALGGVRSAPWDNRIRIDHCAEALDALMRARSALFGEINRG